MNQALGASILEAANELGIYPFLLPKSSKMEIIIGLATNAE